MFFKVSEKSADFYHFFVFLFKYQLFKTSVKNKNNNKKKPCQIYFLKCFSLLKKDKENKITQ